VVVAEDQQALGLEDTVSLGPDGCEPFGKLARITVLNLPISPRGDACMVANVAEDVTLPDVEEISELAVVHVIEERRIGDDSIYTAIADICKARVTARKVQVPLFGAEFVERLCPLPRHRDRKAVNFFISTGYDIQLERVLSIFDAPKQSALKESRK
jgi:hypothetical protein